LSTHKDSISIDWNGEWWDWRRPRRRLEWNFYPELAVRGAGERDVMCFTSSLPSQHDKAYLLYLNLSDYSKNFQPREASLFPWWHKNRIQNKKSSGEWIERHRKIQPSWVKLGGKPTESAVRTVWAWYEQLHWLGMADDNWGARTDKHAEFRSAEKFDEGMALRIWLERKHSPLLSSSLTDLEMLPQKTK